MAQETFFNTYILATRDDNVSTSTAAFTFKGTVNTIAFQIEAKAGNVYFETNGTVSTAVDPYVTAGTKTDWLPANNADGGVLTLSIAGSIASTHMQVLELVAIDR